MPGICGIGAQCTWVCSNIATSSPTSLTCSQLLVRLVAEHLMHTLASGGQVKQMTCFWLDAVNELYGRTFATWTLTTCALCLICAKNPRVRAIYGVLFHTAELGFALGGQ